MSLVSLSCHADDMFARAVSKFRYKNYEESLTLASKSTDSPQRTFLMGISALRQGKPGEALPLLAEAERTLPLLADYAAFFQVEALMALRKYSEAAVKAASIPTAYPSSLLVRRAEKIRIDNLFSAADYPNALSLCRAFIEKYPSGSDSVDTLYLAGQIRETTGDKSGAAQVYRSIWLNSPMAQQGTKSRQRLEVLAKEGITVTAFTVEELLRRASTLSAQNQFSQSLKALQSINREGQPSAVVDRVALRAGLNQYRLRNWKAAEKELARAVASDNAAIRSEGRFWQAKLLERLDHDERAFALFMELTSEGKQQEFADDALMEAAGLRKGMGRYEEAASLYERVARVFPESRSVARATWEAGWCRYLAGEYALAATRFGELLKDATMREKALYWMGRALERNGNADSSRYFSALLSEYPAGFYAAWHRDRKGVRDDRDGLAQRSALSEVTIPGGFEKTRLLASLGLIDEARAELASIRKKSSDRKGLLPGLARIYVEMDDLPSAVGLFQQNRPRTWDKENLPFWSAGFPLGYSGQVSRHATTNKLPESLVYALIRSESSFAPSVRSHAGAVGLMQLMPATARITAREKGTFSPSRLTTPDYNIMLGTKHFRELLNGFDGDVVYSVAAYNAGTSAVERWKKRLKGLNKDEFIESIPYQETRDYVKKVYASAATYRQLYGLK